MSAASLGHTPDMGKAVVCCEVRISVDISCCQAASQPVQQHKSYILRLPSLHLPCITTDLSYVRHALRVEQILLPVPSSAFSRSQRPGNGDTQGASCPETRSRDMFSEVLQVQDTGSSVHCVQLQEAGVGCVYTLSNDYSAQDLRLSMC